MHEEISALFFDAAIAYAQSVGVPLQLPSIAFDKPSVSDDDVYFKVSKLTAEPSVHGVNNGVAQNKFILQLSIYVRDGVGILRTDRYVDELRDVVFPIYSKLEGAEHSYKIIKPITPANEIMIDGWHVTPTRFTVDTIN